MMGIALKYKENKLLCVIIFFSSYIEIFFLQEKFATIVFYKK